MPLPGQLGGQVPQRLGRPPQRRLRVTPLIRLNQRQQRRDQPRIQFRGAPAAPALASGPAVRERILAFLQLEDTPADSGLTHPRDLGDGPDPAMPQQPGLRPQQQPPLPLVQMRRQHLESQRELATSLRRDRHTAISNTKPRPATLFPYSFTTIATCSPASPSPPSPGCPPWCGPSSSSPTPPPSAPGTPRS